MSKKLKGYEQYGVPLRPGPELRRMLDERPEDLWFPLDYFINKFGFDAKDIRAELAAGRLVAETDNAGLQAIRSGRMPQRVAVSIAAVKDWLRNPQTPLRLIDKITAGPIKLN